MRMQVEVTLLFAQAVLPPVLNVCIPPSGNGQQRRYLGLRNTYAPLSWRAG